MVHAEQERAMMGLQPATKGRHHDYSPRRQPRRAAYPDFARLLDEAIHAYGGTQKELAARVGVRPSTLSHLRARRALPSVELCLMLAIVTGADAVRLLIAAGKGKELNMIQKLFGAAAQRAQLTDAEVLPRPNEMELIQLLRRMSPRCRASFAVLIRAAMA